MLNTCKSNEAVPEAQGFGHGRKEMLSGGRVSNAWATCLFPGDNTGKLVLIPHDAWISHGDHAKDLLHTDGLASD